MHESETNGLKICSSPTEPQALSDSQESTKVKITAPGEYRVIRRNGKITSFEISKIEVAMTKAFLAVEGGQAAASRRIHEQVEKLAQNVLHLQGYKLLVS